MPHADILNHLPILRFSSYLSPKLQTVTSKPNCFQLETCGTGSPVDSGSCRAAGMLSPSRCVPGAGQIPSPLRDH